MNKIKYLIYAIALALNLLAAPAIAQIICPQGAVPVRILETNEIQCLFTQTPQNSNNTDQNIYNNQPFDSNYNSEIQNNPYEIPSNAYENYYEPYPIENPDAFQGGSDAYYYENNYHDGYFHDYSPPEQTYREDSNFQQETQYNTEEIPEDLYYKHNLILGLGIGPGYLITSPDSVQALGLDLQLQIGFRIFKYFGLFLKYEMQTCDDRFAYLDLEAVPALMFNIQKTAVISLRVGLGFGYAPHVYDYYGTDMDEGYFMILRPGINFDFLITENMSLGFELSCVFSQSDVVSLVAISSTIQFTYYFDLHKETSD